MERLPKLNPDQNRQYSSLCLSHDPQNPLESYKLNEAMSGTNWIAVWTGEMDDDL